MTARKGSELQSKVPVNIVWDSVLMVSLSGVIDSQVAQEITESMLEKIEETQAKTIILDILGVATLDSAVANHIIKITRMTGLMGCDCVISGVSGSIAQAIVSLGIDLGEVATKMTLKDALEYALDSLGLEVRARK